METRQTPPASSTHFATATIRPPCKRLVVKAMSGSLANTIYMWGCIFASAQAQPSMAKVVREKNESKHGTAEARHSGALCRVLVSSNGGFCLTSTFLLGRSHWAQQKKGSLFAKRFFYSMKHPGAHTRFIIEEEDTKWWPQRWRGGRFGFCSAVQPFSAVIIYA